MGFAAGRRRWIFLAATLVILVLFAQISGVTRSDLGDVLDRVPIPERLKPGSSKAGNPEGVATLKLQWEPRDNHPISKLIAEADKRWRIYEDNRSQTFRETVANYRRKYGRHPPPGFVKWYRFARKHNIHNIDDFDQVMDDLRPFWGVSPKTIRALAAHMWETEDGVSGIHIRGGKVVKNNKESWRPETLITLINEFVKELPDMDIAVNILDQPRVVVPWSDLQQHLEAEAKSRQTMPDALNEFTPKLDGLLNWEIEKEQDNSTREDPGWFYAPGKPYMDIARLGCPPEAHANNGVDVQTAEATWKDAGSGIVSNFNLSSDLCTMGPELADKHGLLFTASTIIATKKLVPIFGECKINVNNDILFPANMYWKHDDRYDYNSKHDVEWSKKKEVMIWRGVTSGGVQLHDNWQRMHRQRLVQTMNSTVMKDKEVSIFSERPLQTGDYDLIPAFKPAEFLENYTDVGFVEAWGCVPDCSFYDDVMTWKPKMPLGDQFTYKYLIDVDGHSFSGRWRAFLESKALGLKATIFREWHDSRLFAWRHFVPLDNRYDEIFSVLAYFTGIGQREDRGPGDPFIPKHDVEAERLALQGREWANKVLRRQDIEV